MNVWKSTAYKEYYSGKTCRKGMRIRFEAGVNDEVKAAIKRLASWLRKNYIFPVRVNIYVKSGIFVKAEDGDMVPDLFFWTYNRDDEPYIKIAVGDYDDLKNELGRDNALATILKAFLLELTHYFQWLNNICKNEPSLQRSARRYARSILNLYAEENDHP